MQKNKKIRFNECQAKLILEHINNNLNFKMLEKPDLQDSNQNVGVEVSTLNDNEIISNYVYYTNYEDIDKKETRLNRLKDLGVEEHGGVLFSFDEQDISTIFKRFENKLEKLNK